MRWDIGLLRDRRLSANRRGDRRGRRCPKPRPACLRRPRLRFFPSARHWTCARPSRSAIRPRACSPPKLSGAAAHVDRRRPRRPKGRGRRRRFLPRAKSTARFVVEAAVLRWDSIRSATTTFTRSATSRTVSSKTCPPNRRRARVSCRTSTRVAFCATAAAADARWVSFRRDRPGGGVGGSTATARSAVRFCARSRDCTVRGDAFRSGETRASSLSTRRTGARVARAFRSIRRRNSPAAGGRRRGAQSGPSQAAFAVNVVPWLAWGGNVLHVAGRDGPRTRARRVSARASRRRPRCRRRSSSATRSAAPAGGFEAGGGVDGDLAGSPAPPPPAAARRGPDERACLSWSARRWSAWTSVTGGSKAGEA